MSMNNNKGSLGLLSCVGIIVGGMIGSAIFSLSGLTMFIAGPGAIFSWIIAAVIMLIYGLVIAELATRFPKSGGVFVFPSKALGKTRKQGSLWGWISTWGYINANIVAVAFAAIYVGTYLGAGFPALGNMQIPLAIVSILICTILNVLKVSVTGKVNTGLVLGLIVALAIYICVCFFGGKWDGAMLSPVFTQGAGGSTGFLSAVPTAMIGYGSIVAIAFMVSEVKNPNRNVPRSVIIAMTVVVILYGLVIIATLGLVSAQFLIENAGMRFIPLYAACFTKLTAFPWLAKVISIAATLALLTTMLVVLALTARAIKASADTGVLPEAFGREGKNGTPVLATVIIAVLSAIVACFPQFTQVIVGFGALFATVTIVINIMSLYQARKKNLHAEGSFRAPGGQWLPAVALILILVCYISDIINGGWILWAYTIGWYIIGYLIFRFSKVGKGANEILNAE